MPKCSFCKKVYEFPRGLTLVLNDGNILYFCSSKCRKNFNLGRKGKKVNWIRKMKHTRAELVADMKKVEAEEKEEEENQEIMQDSEKTKAGKKEGEGKSPQKK